MEKSESLESNNVPKTSEASWGEFKREIESLKAGEAALGGRTVNLSEITVADLTSADMAMWKLFKRSGQNNRAALLSVFEDYRVQTLGAGNPSRNAFVAFLAQELMKTTSQT